MYSSYSRCEYGINTPPAKKIDGARKPNSKEFWARGRDSFDYGPYRSF